MDSTAPQRGAQSLLISASIPRSSLASRIVAPWRPTSPVTITTSPGFAKAPEVSKPSVSFPIPVVVIKTQSTWPFPATFVSPATILTPTSFAVFSIALTISSSLSMEKPSSMTKEQVRYKGFAPMQARSLTVPQILSFPIFPPLNSNGDTIKPSVDIAIFPSPISRTAASSDVNKGFAKCALKTASINSAVWRPPAP